MRLPLVFSTTNDDVVASCSVRENKREREIYPKRALVSLSTGHTKEKKATKKVDVAVSPVVYKSLSFCVRFVFISKKKISSVKTQFFPQNSSFVFTCLGFKIERDKKKEATFRRDFL